jgi:hypothetical protein
MTPDIEYLLSLEAVRERAQIVFAAAKRDELSHFTYHADKVPEAAAFVTSVINVSCCFSSVWSFLLLYQISGYITRDHQHDLARLNHTY